MPAEQGIPYNEFVYRLSLAQLHPSLFSIPLPNKKTDFLALVPTGWSYNSYSNYVTTSSPLHIFSINANYALGLPNNNYYKMDVRLLSEQLSYWCFLTRGYPTYTNKEHCGRVYIQQQTNQIISTDYPDKPFHTFETLIPSDEVRPIGVLPENDYGYRWYVTLGLNYYFTEGNEVIYDTATDSWVRHGDLRGVYAYLGRGYYNRGSWSRTSIQETYYFNFNHTPYTEVIYPFSHCDATTSSIIYYDGLSENILNSTFQPSEMIKRGTATNCSENYNGYYSGFGYGLYTNKPRWT